MVGLLRSCLHAEDGEFGAGHGGLALIFYALWMFRVWFRELHDVGSHVHPPWFIFTILGLGVLLCIISCSGHIAAATVNATITADVFMKSHWEEDLPQDKTGKLDDLKNFIKSNFKFCRWIGLLVVAAQALSIFLAIVLRALGPNEDRYYQIDEEFNNNARIPLLKKSVQPPPYVIDPHIHPKKDTWSRRF